MAFIPEVFETCEQICEVEIAFTGNEMDLVVAGIVGEPYLADAINSELIEKAIYPIRDQMRMVGSERPAQILGWNLIEVLSKLFNGMGYVVYFGPVGFEVQVLEQDSLSGVGTVLADSFQTLDRGLFSLGYVT